MAKSDYLEVNILNHVLRSTSYTSPAAVYVALYTVAPTDAGGGTEVTGSGYARQAVTFGPPGTPAANQVTNTADVEFPIAGAGGWGTIIAFALFDSSVAGNMLYHAKLTAARTIAVGDQFKFPIGQLIVGES